MERALQQWSRPQPLVPSTPVSPWPPAAQARPYTPQTPPQAAISMSLVPDLRRHPSRQLHRPQPPRRIRPLQHPEPQRQSLRHLRMRPRDSHPVASSTSTIPTATLSSESPPTAHSQLRGESSSPHPGSVPTATISSSATSATAKSTSTIQQPTPSSARSTAPTVSHWSTTSCGRLKPAPLAARFDPNAVYFTAGINNQPTASSERSQPNARTRNHRRNRNRPHRTCTVESQT